MRSCAGVTRSRKANAQAADFIEGGTATMNTHRAHNTNPKRKLLDSHKRRLQPKCSESMEQLITHCEVKQQRADSIILPLSRQGEHTSVGGG